MVFAKVVQTGEVSDRALRRVRVRRQNVRAIADRVLTSLPSHDLKRVAVLRSRYSNLSNEVVSQGAVGTQRSWIDVLYPERISTGTWASALNFLQQQVLAPGLELTADHARRVISLWADGSVDKPPVSLLLQWWALISMDRPVGASSDGGCDDSVSLELLPIVAAAMAESVSLSQAMDVVSGEAVVSGGNSPQIVSAVESAIAASMDPNSNVACERRAIQSCLNAMGEFVQARHAQSLLASPGKLLSATTVSALADPPGAPSFTILFSVPSGTLSKTSDFEDRCVFNGIASAISTSRPSPSEGIRLCESFIGATTANTSSVLEEMKLRYLMQVDPVACVAYFDTIPHSHRTPFMMATCLRVLVEEHAYDGAVQYARRMCDLWGSFTIPCSVLNRLCAMRAFGFHSESFWDLIAVCGCRVTESHAKAMLSARSQATPLIPRVPAVGEVLLSLQDLVSLGKVAGARMVLNRVPMIQEARAGGADDVLTLELLGSMGDDWRLALQVLHHA